MSTKRGSLFGGRPDLLLVDERPPGIELPTLEAAASLPELEDEPDEDLHVGIEDDDEGEDADEDSYDGDGPLRIFIGAPKAQDSGAAPAEPSPAAQPPPHPVVEKGPVWDASALAIGADDELEDTLDDDTDPDRGPVLIRPPGDGGEPPPLTMSFGGSFTRGSMDAGVMDADGNLEGEPVRNDTVVVHEEIYDRFLRFDDPVDLPAPGGTAVSDDDAVLEAGEADDEPLAAGDSDDQPLLAGDAEDEVLAVGSAEDSLADGPPPTRVGLSVGFVPPDDEYEDDSGLVEPVLPPSRQVGSGFDAISERQDSLDTLPPFEDGVEPRREDDTDDFAVPQVIIGDQRAAMTNLVSDDSLASSRLVGDLLLGGGGDQEVTTEEDEELVLPPPTAEEEEERTSRTTPEWAVRRREAREGMVRTGEEVAEEEGEEDSGGGLGLLVIVIIAVLCVFLGSVFVGDHSADSGGAARPTPSRSQPIAPDAPEQPAAQPQPATPDVQPAPAGADASPQPTDVEPGATGAADVSAAPDADPAAAGDDTEGPKDAQAAAAAAKASADLGLLRVRATRPARVYIDGELVGETPMAAVSLTSGEHEVKVVALDSGSSRSQKVRIDAGRAQEVRFPF